MVTIPPSPTDAHSPLQEFEARKSWETIAPAEWQLVNPYEYKLINGVYFVRYLIPQEDKNLYSWKERTFDRNSAMMSICDERWYVYVWVVQDPDTLWKIGRALRNKWYAGFDDRLWNEVKKGDDYNHRNMSHSVPLSNIMWWSTELATAIWQAHIWHTQFSVKDKARLALEAEKWVKV